MEYQYCKKVLNSKIALTKHQKSTKSCLVIQGKDIDIYKCPCGSTFCSKTILVQHQRTCGKTLKEQLKESQSENNNLKKQLKNQLQGSQSEIINLKNQLEKAKTEYLESKLEASEKINEHYFKLTDTLARKDTTITINNTIIENLKPLDIDKLCDYSDNLSLEHIQGVLRVMLSMRWSILLKISCCVRIIPVGSVNIKITMSKLLQILK